MLYAWHKQFKIQNVYLKLSFRNFFLISFSSYSLKISRAIHKSHRDVMSPMK